MSQVRNLASQELDRPSCKQPFWLGYLPERLRTRVAQRPGLLKILGNIGWLSLDKVLRMGVGLFVGVWIARYLGPEQFGQLSYAITFVALFGGDCDHGAYSRHPGARSGQRAGAGPQVSGILRLRSDDTSMREC